MHLLDNTLKGHSFYLIVFLCKVNELLLLAVSPGDFISQDLQGRKVHSFLCAQEAIIGVHACTMIHACIMPYKKQTKENKNNRQIHFPAFPLLEKVSDTQNLKEGRHILAHDFIGFTFWLFGSLMETWWWKAHAAKLLTSWQLGCKHREEASSLTESPRS